MGILKYDRKKFFEGVGTNVATIKQDNLEDIIKYAGLDYMVEKVKSYDEDGEEIGSYHTRYFDADGVKHNIGSGLKAQYTVLQNSEAFGFLQDILGDIQIECAGTINDGKSSFVCASTEPLKVLNEEISPFVVFQNSFDGSGSVRAMLTPIRVFCSNCMMSAIRNAESKISIKHSTNVVQRLYASQEVLMKNKQYLATYKTEVEQMATVTLSTETFENKVVPFTLRQMGLLDSSGNPIEKKRNKDIVDVYRENLMQCWNNDDTQNQKGTLLNCVNAITDFDSHYQPMRNADNPETIFKRVLAGMTLSAAVIEMAKETVGYSFSY